MEPTSWAFVVAAVSALGGVLVVVDKQRRAWFNEANATMQKEIDELRALRNQDQAEIIAMKAQIAAMQDGNREARAAISDAMVLIAKGATQDESLEALRAAVKLIH